VTLDTVLLGGKRYTSRQALERFFSAATAAAEQGVAYGGHPVTDVAHFEQQLDNLGI
jgi:hypothetical protein